MPATPSMLPDHQEFLQLLRDEVYQHYCSAKDHVWNGEAHRNMLDLLDCPIAGDIQFITIRDKVLLLNSGGPNDWQYDDVNLINAIDLLSYRLRATSVDRTSPKDPAE